MTTKMMLTFVTVMTCVLLGATALDATAQFRVADFEYGSRFRLPDGTQLRSGTRPSGSCSRAAR